MARLSKAHSFAIYEDTGISTPDADNIPEWTGATNVPKDDQDCIVTVANQVDIEAAKDNTIRPHSFDLIEHDTTSASDAGDERRESTGTSPSLSSTADSVYRTDIDNVLPMHQPYTPPFIRPSFRRPQSVQRMQMTSPTSSRIASPRNSFLNKSSSKNGTPRSARSATAKGSPRSRRRWIVQESSEEEKEEEEEEEDEERKQNSLVLLHVVLLPTHAQWSEQSMEQVLPQHTLEQFRSLRLRVSDTVLERGVLIPHPREDYRLLEERLLEALELQQPRITPCGHFIPRPLSANDTSGNEDAADSDSGIGSSLAESHERICATCFEPVQAKSGSWDVKAFASNGLLRASAWAAAWTEMERVDVEILPFIDDETRTDLNERKRSEDEERRQRDSDTADKATYLARMVDLSQLKHSQQAQHERAYAENTASDHHMSSYQRATKTMNEIDPSTAIQQTLVEGQRNDLPDVYRPSQIPLSVLLKNYVYLLAQDRRNVVIFFFVTLLAVLLATRSSNRGRPSAVDIVHNAYPNVEPPAKNPVRAMGYASQTLVGEDTVAPADGAEIAMEMAIESDL